MKRLQFGTKKCFKLHVGKTCNQTLCKDLFVGGWKMSVAEDVLTGKCTQVETFVGDVKMGLKEEQMYLGDIISADASHKKNIEHRKNKGYGVINQIMQILETAFFGKYYFEVALVLRSSMFLSSLLLNSEAWVNLTEKDIRSLEQSDEILLSRILDCDAHTSNVAKYLELGVVPVKFEIIKRKIIYLQYILQQEKSSMVYKVFQATQENPVNNDFVKSCLKYLEMLDIKMSFSEIEDMSTWRFKKIVKEKTNLAAYTYLMEKKNQPNKQTKIANLKYEKLEMQDYLLDGNFNTQVSKVVYKARTQTLDIKTHKRWKYDDDICVACHERQETIQELLTCTYLSDKNEETKPMHYDWLISGSGRQMFKVGQVLAKRLKAREKIIEGIT